VGARFHLPHREAVGDERMASRLPLEPASQNRGNVPSSSLLLTAALDAAPFVLTTGAASARIASAGNSFRKLRATSGSRVCSHASHSAGGTMTTERFSSPGRCMRLRTGCDAALTVSIVKESDWSGHARQSPAMPKAGVSGSQIFQRSALPGRSGVPSSG